MPGADVPVGEGAVGEPGEIWGTAGDAGKDAGAALDVACAVGSPDGRTEADGSGPVSWEVGAHAATDSRTSATRAARPAGTPRRRRPAPQSPRIDGSPSTISTRGAMHGFCATPSRAECPVGSI